MFIEGHQRNSQFFKDSLLYAQEQVKLFFEKAVVLERHPFSGRPVPELQDPLIRQLLCGNYRIIYEILNSDQTAITYIINQDYLRIILQ